MERDVLSNALYYFRFGESEERRNKDKKSGFELVVATFLHLKKPYQLLILPLTIWSGMEQGFFFSDYTAVSKMQRVPKKIEFELPRLNDLIWESEPI